MIPQLSQLQQSLHRACCCGCPIELTVDVVGVDAAKCGCTVTGGSSSQLTSLLTVDGAYVIPKISEGTVGGRPICNYQSCYDTGGTIATIEEYSGTVCAGAPTLTKNLRHIVVSVTLYQESGKIRFLSMGLPTFFPDCAIGYTVYQIGPVAYPGLDLATTHSNGLSCSSGNVASGGTMEVNT